MGKGVVIIVETLRVGVLYGLKARISSYSDYELPSSCQSGFPELFRSITECFFSM